MKICSRFLPGNILEVRKDSTEDLPTQITVVTPMHFPGVEKLRVWWFVITFESDDFAGKRIVR
jgi:hypothetical protein